MTDWRTQSRVFAVATGALGVVAILLMGATAARATSPSSLTGGAPSSSGYAGAYPSSDPPVHGSLQGIELTPNGGLALQVGTPVLYHAEAVDPYGADLGDVTAETTFIVDNGTCVANLCTVSSVGQYEPQQVTGSYAGVTAVAQLTVSTYPPVAAYFVISPADPQVPAGNPSLLSAIAYNSEGEFLGGAADPPTFSMTNGTCSGGVCVADKAVSATP